MKDLFPVELKSKVSNECGFTLIEMAMVMVIVGIIISIMMTVMPTLLKTGKIKETKALLNKYDLALQGYAMANNRLPFADNDGDGREDNVFVGDLPYLTLGLTHGNDVWGQPVKYAVYGGSGTDLTDIATKLEFQTNLNTAIGLLSGAVNQNVVYLSAQDACSAVSAVNQAYVLASGGPKDLDGANGFFDRCNGTAGVGFNADNKIQATDYDDLVRPMSLVTLRGLIP